MTTLRVIVDQMAAPTPGALGRYSEDLTRALIEAAPRDCDVEGIVAASSSEKYDLVEGKLPGLCSLYKTTLPRRELAASWHLGLSTSPGTGMIHAPGLLAPLRRHDTLNDGMQVVVTVHDVLAWTHPNSLTNTTVAWRKGMLKRARKHADAVVVPSHALAAELSELVNLGDRIRVVESAPRAGLTVPVDADARAAALQLPSEYLVTAGSLEPRTGVTELITGLAATGAVSLPILVIGPELWGEQDLATVADEAGLAEGQVRALGDLAVEDLAVVLSRASAFVYPAHTSGFGASVLEAFSLGVPVIHSDAPALLEVSGDAGIAVSLAESTTYPERLAIAVAEVLEDNELRQRLGIAGRDRARLYSWRSAAEQVWALHADL